MTDKFGPSLPRPARPPSISADGYGDPDHDDIDALGADRPPPPDDPPADA